MKEKAAPCAGLVAILLASSASTPRAHEIVTSRFDFHGDVEPILRKHCVSCHSQDAPGPFSLETYREARPRAVALKEEVLLRRMPPWYAERGPLPLAGEDHLSAREIDVLVEWASGGAPQGSPAEGRAAGGGGAAPEPPGAGAAADLVIELGEVALSRDEPRRTLDLEVPAGLDAPRHLAAWDVECSDPRLLRGTVLRRGPRPDGFLGSQAAGEGRRAYPAGTGAPLGPEDDLAIRVFLVRPWQARETVLRVACTLRLWLHRDPPARVLRAVEVPAGRHALPAANSLHAVFPYRPLEIRAAGDPPAAEAFLEVFAARERWPRSYTLVEPLAAVSGLEIACPNPGPAGILLLSVPASKSAH